jgi:putative SOS response-associated peptidase YedK
MCARVRQTTPPEQIAELFDTVNPLLNAPPRWNLAPKQDALAVMRAPDGARQLTALRWGLVPYWAKDEAIGMKCINARGETVATAPAFREAFKQRRCLIPVDGYYEWKAEGKLKRPFEFALASGQPLALAGLWESWRQPRSSEAQGSETLRTFTIVTTTVNELAADIHDRMPVILTPKAQARWLGEEPAEAGDLARLLQPYPAGQMIRRPVSMKLNNWRNEGPEVLVADWSTQQPLLI